MRDVQTLSSGNNRGIDRSQWQVPILAHQFGDAQPVPRRHRLDRELACGQVAQETDFGICAEPSSDEVDHFGDNERWDDQRTGMAQEELEAVVMVPVVGVDVGIKRPSVDQDRYSTTSTARISSIRSDMSSRPLRPAPAARN